MSSEYSPESRNLIAEGWVRDIENFKAENSTLWLYGNKQFLVAKRLLDEAPSEFVEAFRQDLVRLRGEEFATMTKEEIGQWLEVQNRVWWGAVWPEDVSGFVARAGHHISEGIRVKVDAKVAELSDFLIDDADCAVLKKDVLGFLSREDLTRPFGPDSPIPYAQHYRTFELQIGMQKFRCTAVSDAAYGHKHSFVLENDKGRKMSPVLELFDRERFGTEWVSNFKKTKMDIYEIAVHAVDDFMEMLDLQAQIHSGKRYGTLDVFGFMLHVLANEGKVVREEVEPLLGDDKNPAAIIALEIDAWRFRAANSTLSAIEFAGMAVDSQEDLKGLVGNREKFIVYCMKGIMTLFKEVFGVASGRNVPEEEQKAPWEIPVFGKKDNKSYENRSSVM